MNVLLLLRPKVNTAYIYDDNTLRQGLEKMKRYGYSAIPVIDREGRYKGTVTEGDFLWKLTEENAVDVRAQERISIKDILRTEYAKAININASIEEVLQLALNQNFVPVTDDIGSFIGIVTRRDILKHYYNLALANIRNDEEGNNGKLL